MTALESWVFAYLFNSLWQIPLLFLAAWVAARLARPLSPQMEHRVWVVALVLQPILPLCSFHAAGWLAHVVGLLRSFFGGTARGEIRVIVEPGSALSGRSLTYSVISDDAGCSCLCMQRALLCRAAGVVTVANC